MTAADPQTNTSSIDSLQKALSMELTAAHQYQLHAHVLDDWGLDRLAQRMRDEMQEEIGHQDRFIARILFLGGTPELKMAATPGRATSLKDMFRSDLEDEKDAIRTYTEAARKAAEEGDLGTRRMFEKVVVDEEGHMDWLSTQLDLIDRLGESNYATRQMSHQDAN